LDILCVLSALCGKKEITNPEFHFTASIDRPARLSVLSSQAQNIKRQKPLISIHVSQHKKLITITNQNVP
jgi:hypothetical protein